MRLLSITKLWLIDLATSDLLCTWVHFCCPVVRFIYDYELELCALRQKRFYPLQQGHSLLKKFIPELCHESDGLILQVHFLVALHKSFMSACVAHVIAQPLYHHAYAAHLLQVLLGVSTCVYTDGLVRHTKRTSGCKVRYFTVYPQVTAMCYLIWLN